MKRRLFAELIILGIVLLLPIAVADTGIYVEFPDGSTHKECLDVPDGTSGFDLLHASSLSVTWSDPGAYGRALCKINGAGDDVAGTACSWGAESWAYFILENSQWRLAPVGLDTPGSCWNRDFSSFGGKYCARDGDVLGFVRTDYDLITFQPKKIPKPVTFEEVCNKLLIEDIDVKVDGRKSSNLRDGDRISRRAKPSSDISFDITLRNLDKENKLRDASVKVTIKDIDDGDDLEEETSEFTIRKDDDKKESIDFTLPLIVEEDDYEVLIEAEGRSEDGRKYYSKATLALEVDKDSHDLRISRAELEPPEVRCGSTSVLTLEVANAGTRDEDDVTLKVRSSELGFSAEESLELPADDVDESVFRTSYLIDTSSAEKSGAYAFMVEAYYDSKLGDSEKLLLAVRDCESKPGKEEAGAAPLKKEEVVVVEEAQEQPVVLPPSAKVVYAYKPEPAFLERYWKIILLIVADALLVVLVLVLLRKAIR